MQLNNNNKYTCNKLVTIKTNNIIYYVNFMGFLVVVCNVQMEVLYIGN